MLLRLAEDTYSHTLQCIHHIMDRYCMELLLSEWHSDLQIELKYRIIKIRLTIEYNMIYLGKFVTIYHSGRHKSILKRLACQSNWMRAKQVIVLDLRGVA